MGRGPFLALVCAAALLAGAAQASAAVYGPPAGRIFHGGTGGYTERTLVDFGRLSGRRPAVYQYFFTPNWKRPSPRSIYWQAWLLKKTARQGARPILHLSTARGGHGHSVITPRQIARGGGDRYLVRLGRLIAASGQVVYVRLMAEMNNFNNPYCAVDGTGEPRGPAHSAAAFRQAWRRATLILRGGSRTRIDARLRRLGMPRVRAAGARLARAKVATMWNPFTAGLPDVGANSAGAYWPGSAYVDWVGTDLFANSPNFRGLERFYDDPRWRNKPFMLGEWALWGREDPGFVRRLMGWTRSHHRARMEVYNQGGRMIWYLRLRNFPASARAYRRQLRSRRFNAYAPELRRRRRRPPPPPAYEPPPPPDEVPPPPPSGIPNLLPGVLPPG